MIKNLKQFKNQLFLLTIFTSTCTINFPGFAVDNAFSRSSNLPVIAYEQDKPASYFVAAIELAKLKKGKRREKFKKNRKEKTLQHQSNEKNKSTKACLECETLDGYVPPDKISNTIRLMVGKARKSTIAKAVEIQRERGVIETGLKPKFLKNANCPEIDSEKWAIDYSHKRPWPALHKGIDIPQPRGTPVRAVAAGTIIGKFINKNNRKGIEVMVRHTPKQTGLPFWTYSQYTHLKEMSPLKLGTQVELGEEIGTISNTGKMGRRVRRDALHFAIFFSETPEWSNDGRFVIPKESFWMDPNAFYRLEAPYDSVSLSKLPQNEKNVPVPYIGSNGSFEPSDTKRVWPFKCM